jgi:hypothetical protein
VLRRTAVIACLLGTVGAGASEAVRDPGACAGSCPHPISYALDPRFDEEEQALIREAMQLWERGTGGRVCFAPAGEGPRQVTGPGGGRELVIERLERSDQLQPWDPSDWPHHVALTKGGRIWIVAPRVDDRGEYRALIVHELGHHLGIGHIEDTPFTYMHSTINDTPPEMWLHPRLPPRDARAYCEVHRCTCQL